MTTYLHHVSQSLLAAGDHEDNIIDKPVGGTSLAHYHACNARSTPPTTTAQMRKFVHAEPIPDVNMLSINVTLKKEDYGFPHLSDYFKNMAIAAVGLTKKFGVAHHKKVAVEKKAISPRAHMHSTLSSTSFIA